AIQAAALAARLPLHAGDGLHVAAGDLLEAVQPGAPGGLHRRHPSPGLPRFHSGGGARGPGYLVDRMELSVQVDEVEPGSAVVRVRGDVDVLSVEKLRTPLQDLAARGVRDVVLDLQEAGYFDSSGMGMLLAVYGRLSAVEGSLALARLSPGLQRLFSLTRFD